MGRSLSFVPAISYQPFIPFRSAEGSVEDTSPLHGEMAEARVLPQIGGAPGVEIDKDHVVVLAHLSYCLLGLLPPHWITRLPNRYKGPSFGIESSLKGVR